MKRASGDDATVGRLITGRLSLALLIFIPWLAGAAVSGVTTVAGAAASPAGPLRSLAQTRGFLIGAGDVNIGPFLSDSRLTHTLAREFNILTPGNAMKFYIVHPAPELYYFGDADAMVAFAKAHQMQVRGHTLVWHLVVPDWVATGTFNRDELKEILRDHIHSVVGHFRGQILAWDVVNEAVDDDGSLRDTVWLRGIGPEYIDLAFQWAHEADPGALLFYNDYGGEGLGKKSGAIHALVQGLLARGVPINGVGLQMHLRLGRIPKAEDVAANIRRLGALGLDVHITEMDVATYGAAGSPEEKLTAQARVYHDMLAVCLAAPNCKAFLTWGVSDRDSWIPWWFGHPDAPLLYGDDYTPKPAYYSLADALSGR